MSGFDTAVQLTYLAAAACFVLGLHLMNSPATARHGNRLSASAMVVAVVATAAVLVHDQAITATGWACCWPAAHWAARPGSTPPAPSR